MGTFVASRNLLKNSRTIICVFLVVFGVPILCGCSSLKATATATLTLDAQGLEIVPTPSKSPVNIETPTFTISSTPLTLNHPTLTPSPESSPTLTPTLEPGSTQISPMDNMVLVYIPAGEFMMGSTSLDEGADEDEFPQHRVYLDDFWIDQTVITNALYSVFLNEMGNQFEGNATWLDTTDEDALIFLKDGFWQPQPEFHDYPAVEITWYGARAYCDWAGRRLPTEAEWEKAARMDGNRVYPWGDEIDCERAVYANCKTGLQPVGSKPAGASPYGVLGLSGNVWEWVADWYAADYYFYTISDNPVGPEDGIARVLRGGSWEYDWKHLRAANRRNNGPATSMHDYGFRCVTDYP